MKAGVRGDASKQVHGRPPMPASKTPTKRRPAAKPAKPAARRAKPRPRARRRAPWRQRVPVLEQRHLDLIGLGLFAAGVFLAFPLYSGWDAGAGGTWLIDALRWVCGEVAYAVPVASP